VITYVDTSVLITVLVEEPGTDAARRLWSEADALASVTLVAVEARAALAAARRGRRLAPARYRRAVSNLGELLDQLDLIGVGDEIVELAGDLAESAPLRGDDAVHLAGALLVEASVMASADRALCSAAERLGLHIAHPTGAGGS
jgi:predicted nucleic acid-binding protein